VPKNVLVATLLNFAVQEVLDQRNRVGPEGFRVLLIKILRVLVNEAQNFGWLLGFLAADLLQDAVLAVLDVLETLVECLEDGEEDVHVLVAVKVVPGARKWRIGLEFPVHVEEV